MSTSANRRFRSARNTLAEALGLGDAFPLRDLPVSADPPIVPFGGTATIGIADSEAKVTYQLLDQTGKPLPGNGGPQATGNGDLLAIASPEVDEDVTYMIGAAQPNGRSAVLFEAAAIKVGLDASLPVTVVSTLGVPTVIDHGATVTFAIEHSQEGVTYSLVARPSPDPLKPDDPGGAATDTPLSAASTPGTGGTITLSSLRLADDIVVRVRATKTFTGRNARPAQTVLLAKSLPVFVRPDAGLQISANAPIVDHGGASGVTIAKAAAGIAYRLYGRAVADAEFNRADPPPPGLVEVATPDGKVRITPPAPTVAWEVPPGFAPLGDAVTGNGGGLNLPGGSFGRDTLLIVEARKTHGSGADAFTSAERLDMAAAVLVRPDTKPGLRIEALAADGKLLELSGLAGEPGVFYAIAAPAPAGELYFHQIDPGDGTLNKGVGALAVEVDMVPAAGPVNIDTSHAPPPRPRLAMAGLALQATLKLTARRAMTRLTADLGTVAVPALPAVQLPVGPVAAGGSAKVIIAQPVAGERYRLIVAGKPVGDPVPGAAAAITLDTGPLAAGAAVELWAAAGDPAAAVTVERRAPLAIQVAG